MTSLLKRKRYLIAAFVVLLAVVFYAALKYSANAEVAVFYSGKCLGTWQNPNKAQGKPEVENADLINEDNSAFFDGGIKEIYCGDFQGEVPKGKIKNIQLKFNWLITETKKQPVSVVTSQSESSEQTANLIDKIIQLIPSRDVEIIVSSVASDGNGTSTQETITDIKTPEQEATSSTYSGNLNQEMNTNTDTDTNTENKQEENSSPPSVEIQDTDSTIINNNLEQNNNNNNNLNQENIKEENPSSTSFFRKIFPFVFAQEDNTNSNLELNNNSLPTSTDSNLSTSSSEIINTQNPTSTNELTSTSSEEISGNPLSGDDFLQISYTLDGVNWQNLGGVNKKNWQDLTLTIPISEWNDLSKIQIKINSIPLADNMPYVYLESVQLAVEYEQDSVNVDSQSTTSSVISALVENIAQNIGLIGGNSNDQSSSSEQSENIENQESQNSSQDQLSYLTNELAEKTVQKPPKEIKIDESARYSCKIDPFTISVGEGQKTSGKIITKRDSATRYYKLETGNLPYGIEIILDQNATSSDFKEINSDDPVVFSVVSEIDSQKGSLNIPIIFSEKTGEDSFLNTLCQFNLLSN